MKNFFPPLAVFIILSGTSVSGLTQSLLQKTIVITPKEFFVSGVMRSKSDGDVIKLVHSTKIAASTDEAVGAFTRDVLDAYPGYSLFDALATPMPSKRSVKCDDSI